jgi:hypothetical protein
VSGYKLAQLTTLYETVPYAVKSRDAVTTPDGRVFEQERFCVRTVKFAGQYASFPSGALRYADADPRLTGKPVTENAGVILPYQSVELNWIGIPEDGVPVDAIETCFGRGNQTQFWDGVRNYDPETLLLTGAELERHVDPSGQRIMNVRYAFNFVKEGLNRVYAPTVSRYAAVVRIADASQGMYEAAEFQSLFTVQQDIHSARLTPP